MNSAENENCIFIASDKLHYFRSQRCFECDLENEQNALDYIYNNGSASIQKLLQHYPMYTSYLMGKNFKTTYDILKNEQSIIAKMMCWDFFNPRNNIRSVCYMLIENDVDMIEILKYVEIVIKHPLNCELCENMGDDIFDIFKLFETKKLVTRCLLDNINSRIFNMIGNVNLDNFLEICTNNNYKFSASVMLRNVTLTDVCFKKAYFCVELKRVLDTVCDVKNENEHVREILNYLTTS